jgi:hypothetical protein
VAANHDAVVTKAGPVLTTDAQAEAFLAKDLSALDFAQFQPLRF